MDVRPCLGYGWDVPTSSKPIRDPWPPNTSQTITPNTVATGAVIAGTGTSQSWISSGKIATSALDLQDLAQQLGSINEPAQRMTEVCAELAGRLGITMDEAMKSMQASALVIKARDVADNGPTARRQTMAVGVDEYGLLVRVANMAGQLLSAMREAGVDEKEYARYTALRNSLVALQIHETTLAVDPLGENELAADLARLVSELEHPTTPPST